MTHIPSRAGVAIVHGGDAFARQVYRHERRGYWAAALPLALEKHGFLDVAVLGPEALEDPDTWTRHAAVLVARLPEGAWTPEAIALALAAPGLALVEGPLPHELCNVLDVAAEPTARDGRLVVVERALGRATHAFSPPVGSWVRDAATRETDRDPTLNWDALDGLSITAQQAEAWRAPGWDAQWLSAQGEVEVLAEWRRIDDESDRCPGAVRRDGLIGFNFGVLSHIGQMHTSAPAAGRGWRSWTRPTALEALVLALIDSAHVRAGLPRVRVLPWPQGFDWVLNIRHDFDRWMDRGEVQEVLDRHASAATAATWYWRARHIRDQSAAVVPRVVAAAPDQEVAHHTELIWIDGEREQRTIESALRRPVFGTAAHGDPTSFRWQGAPNVLWAERQGHLYTELIEHSHLHPHRFAALRDDGRIEALDVICLPHHESFDRSTRPGDTAADQVVARAPTYAAAGGMMQVLNHPDINGGELFDCIAKLPSERRLDWTARDAADWWSRTHVSGELILRRSDDGRMRVTARRAVAGVMVETLLPDGSRAAEVLDLLPNREVALAAGRADQATDRWSKQLAPAFAQATREYESGYGRTPTSATIQTNSTLVPDRARSLVELVRSLTDVSSLAGRRVLEVGAGFGALATYLALTTHHERFLAVDIRDEFVATAARIATEHDVSSIEFRRDDLRTLASVDEEFDLVVVNNTFLYLTTAADMERAAQALSRVVAPGGALLIYHANKWRWREPFTRAPIVHLLPPQLATAVSTTTGWRNSHGRVRLVSPLQLGRLLRNAGFDDVQVGAPSPNGVIRGWRGYFRGFYAVGARRRSAG